MTLPPGGEKSMVDALRSVMLPARLERGCTRAQVLTDVDAADSIDYVEEWQSPEDMQERIRSASFSRLLSLMEAAASAPSIEFRDVSGVHGLEYVAAAREPSPILAEGHEHNG
jgi:quinol monooxygenase YgiN